MCFYVSLWGCILLRLHAELLVRKEGTTVESMCLAGTTSCGETEAEKEERAQALMADDKNRREHEFVVSFMRDVFGRNCYNVSIPRNPSIKALRHVQHLCTPVSAQVMEGRSLLSLASQLHPTLRFREHLLAKL